MTESLKVKGAGLLSCGAALKGSPRFRAVVPPVLHRYLDEPILMSAWYPAEDYMGLLEALAKVSDPRVVGANPYFFFGRVAAQRDIKGSEELLPEKQRTGQAGVYRGAIASARGVASLIKRSLALRQLHYSAGSYVVKRTGERTLSIRLENFPLVSANLCSLTLGYMTEAFRRPEIDGTVTAVSCRGKGGAECVWELRLGPGIDVSELVAFE